MGELLTTNTSGNPISTHLVPVVETGRHRTVEVPYPSNPVTRKMTDRLVDFVVSWSVICF